MVKKMKHVEKMKQLDQNLLTWWLSSHSWRAFISLFKTVSHYFRSLWVRNLPQCGIWNAIFKFSEWNFFQSHQLSSLSYEKKLKVMISTKVYIQHFLDCTSYIHHSTFMCLAFNTIPWAPSPTLPRIWYCSISAQHSIQKRYEYRMR